MFNLSIFPLLINVHKCTVYPSGAGRHIETSRQRALCEHSKRFASEKTTISPPQLHPRGNTVIHYTWRDVYLLEWLIYETGARQPPVNLDRLQVQLKLIQGLKMERERERDIERKCKVKKGVRLLGLSNLLSRYSVPFYKKYKKVHLEMSEIERARRVWNARALRIWNRYIHCSFQTPTFQTPSSY